MTEPYIGEIRMMGFSFAPPGFAQCDGQLLTINQNQSLFSILGTTYGGDGETTFGLPDLRSRVPIHVGSNGSTSHTQGERGGEDAVSLTVAQIGAHHHALRGGASADAAEAEDTVPGMGETNVYRDPGTPVAMHPSSIANGGSGQGHPNMQPFLAINFVIALTGLFPPNN